jgi:GNAT superfamily N-acetyltransferase
MSNSLMRNGLMRNGQTPSRSTPDDLGSLVIRRIGPDDLRSCAELAVDRGWWPERGKWLLLLDESDCWGVDAPDGRGLAGTVVLTRWGPNCGAIGMMLTAARYGGRGLGRRLMEHALREAGDAAISLYATAPGRPLYDKLGFQPLRRNVAFRGTFRAEPSRRGKKREARAVAASPAGVPGIVREFTEADLPAIIALDRASYGGDRERMLNRLPGFAERIVVFEAAAGIAGQRITGYGAAWRTELATVIGPLVAPDGAAARGLATDLAAHATTMVRLDLDPDRPELPGWAQAHGLLPTEHTVFMTRGDLTPRGIKGHCYSPISVAMA